MSPERYLIDEAGGIHEIPDPDEPSPKRTACHRPVQSRVSQPQATTRPQSTEASPSAPGCATLLCALGLATGIVGLLLAI